MTTTIPSPDLAAELPPGLAAGGVPGSASPDAVDATTRPGRRVEHGWWGVLLVGLGVLGGGGAVGDNSFLTHWATGRLILAGETPHADPYTFLVRGRAWTVQSWGASVLYAALERIGGAGAIRLTVAAATAAVVALLWRLSRPAGGLVGRVLLVGMAAVVGFSWWSERPQVFAFVCMGLTALVLVEGRTRWWLVVVFAVWINLHGSFPLGLVLIAVWGTRDALSRRRVPTAALHAFGAATSGAVAGALVSPYGLALFTFPAHMLGQSDNLRYIVEWRPPGLAEWYTAFFAVQVIGVLWVIGRTRRWAELVPLTCFCALAVTSARNVPVASIALVPLGAAAFAGIGDLRVGPPLSRRALVIAGAAIATAAVIGVGVTRDVDLSAYPVAAIDDLDARGWVARPDVRIVTHDYVGNYLEWRYGDRANTWIDDRAELLPPQAIEDYVQLLTPGRPHAEILDRYRADVVVWSATEVLADVLDDLDGWRVVRRDRRWVVACRIGELDGC